MDDVVKLVGLDLGQAKDFAALVVLERTPLKRGSRKEWRFACRYLHRWPLGTSYPDIVSSVARLLEKPPLFGCQLAIDRTGVGAPVVDLFRRMRSSCTLHPVLITAGHRVTRAPDGWHVPKKELAKVLQALLQTNRLQIAEALPLASVLEKELLSFRVKITDAGNETFQALRQTDHDDMVLALALAAWLGERCGG